MKRDGRRAGDGRNEEGRHGRPSSDDMWWVGRRAGVKSEYVRSEGRSKNAV